VLRWSRSGWPVRLPSAVRNFGDPEQVVVGRLVRTSGGAAWPGPDRFVNCAQSRPPLGSHITAGERLFIRLSLAIRHPARSTPDRRILHIRRGETASIFASRRSLCREFGGSSTAAAFGGAVPDDHMNASHGGPAGFRGGRRYHKRVSDSLLPTETIRHLGCTPGRLRLQPGPDGEFVAEGLHH
jgi:hypothetical protein